jgi:hypothetical protein
VCVVARLPSTISTVRNESVIELSADTDNCCDRFCVLDANGRFVMNFCVSDLSAIDSKVTLIGQIAA